MVVAIIQIARVSSPRPGYGRKTTQSPHYNGKAGLEAPRLREVIVSGPDGSSDGRESRCVPYISSVGDVHLHLERPDPSHGQVVYECKQRAGDEPPNRSKDRS